MTEDSDDLVAELPDISSLDLDQVASLANPMLAMLLSRFLPTDPVGRPVGRLPGRILDRCQGTA